MTLVTGTRLGPYEIVSALGAGGMGEVYRARDTRLDREAAVKVLPDTFAGDAEFRGRFEREAKAVAALSHPNIVQIYELGADRGRHYAAMELLEGETLRERLSGGALPLRKVVDYALQIAHGLAAAHARGIVHRDLKPENIFITRQGRVKILDFGLAKVAEPHFPSDVTGATPVSAAGTMPGIVLGTVGYMAPEQVRAQPVDHRTDIFAFGAVLFEMATGRRAFTGPSAVETMHAILNADPIEPAAPTGPALPPGLERVVRHCLEKNPEERFHSAHDLAFALQALSSVGTEPMPARTVARTPAWLFRAIALVALVAAAAALVSYWRQSPPAARPVVFNILPPTTAPIDHPAVSPDGSRIAFLSMSGNSTGDAIWIRRPDNWVSQKLEGTGGAQSPFWSPDGRSLAFFSGGKLKTIELATGQINLVCDALPGFGGSWGSDGTILFSPGERSPIVRVKASGGTPVAVTTIDKSSREESHRWPQFLPDGRHFLFMSWTSTTTVRPIRVGSLDGGTPRTLFESQSAAVLMGGADYLLFVSDDTSRLMARPFDARRRELTGPAFQLLAENNVSYYWFSGDITASASSDTLVYTTGKFMRSQLTWFTRVGQPGGTVGEPATYFDPSISRDGRRLVVEKHDFDRGSSDLWTVDLDRGAFARMTAAEGYENVAVWSPDGRRLAYASDQQQTARIYVRDAGGAGDEQVLVDGRAFPMDWSSDGRYLLYMSGGATTVDISAYDMQQRRSFTVISSPFAEDNAAFSPDVKWIAYTSDESQQRQVYIRSFPDPSIKVPVSTGGGAQPQWRKDGRELFYVAPDGTLMSVDIDTAGKQLRAGSPRPLFATQIDPRRSLRNGYAVSSDGERFLVNRPVERYDAPLVTVLNWRSLLPR